MQRLTTREMREDDLPQVLEIERASFSTPCSRDFFLNATYGKNTLSKVAVCKGKVVGYLCATYRHHESRLLSLAVREDFRRQRVAGILMGEAAGEMKKRGCVFMYLKVRVSNLVARKFYERLGCKVENLRKNYYEKPEEDAMLMSWRI